MKEKENENGGEVCFFLKPEIMAVDKRTWNTLPIRSNMYILYIKHSKVCIYFFKGKLGVVLGCVSAWEK